MFDSVEEYLGSQISEWENFTRAGLYPNIEEHNLDESWTKLKSDFISKTLYLPPDFKEFSVQSLYWRGLANGKLSLNHTEEELNQYIMSTLDDFDEEES